MKPTVLLSYSNKSIQRVQAGLGKRLLLTLKIIASFLCEAALTH